MTGNLNDDLGVAEWFGGAEIVLFMHAHPDDETIATGGTIAGLAANGLKPAVLTFTRGEQGETTELVAQRIAAGADLVDVRLAELQSALEILGVEEHAFLGTAPARAIGHEYTIGGAAVIGGTFAEDTAADGIIADGTFIDDTIIDDTVIYEDSGMEWGPDGFARASSSVGDAALTKHPAVNIINDAISYAVHVEAEAIVSYDERGGYGHPDHILAHRVARAVAHGLEIPFYSIETKFEESIEPAGEPSTELSADPRTEPSTEPSAGPSADLEGQLAEAEQLITIDVTPWMPQKINALRQFESQVTVTDEAELVHVGGQRHLIATSEAYLRHEAIQISSIHEE